MKMRNIMIAGMVMLVLMLPVSIVAARSDQASLDVKDDMDDIEPYNGSIGPDSALYGLKIAFEDIDETFTFNATEKLKKQISHQEQRLAEAKAKLIEKKTREADRALEQYMEKVNELNATIAGYKGTDTGILNAQNMTRKHQAVLLRLLESHPDNTGISRAYNNSLKLEEKFRHKIQERDEEDNENHKEDKLKISAEVIGNATKVKVSLKFETNSTDNATIAQEILDKLQLSTNNISDILKLEVEDDEYETPEPAVTVKGTPTATLTVTPKPTVDNELREKLEAMAKIDDGYTEVDVEFMFLLSTTNETGIIDGVHQKLSALTATDISNVLEIQVKKDRKEIKEKEEKREIKEERDDTKEKNKTMEPRETVNRRVNEEDKEND
ncbi:MAG: hypothetical protein FIB08_08320 [Candidatus Methanoperedens sp.]|nr:hypothetical protein [Candidatus Methanoperedens sp.]